MQPLSALVAWMDTLLRRAEIADWPQALNGLQVENSGRVTRIAAAVDASETTIGMAARAGCDLLIVHHGLFWQGAQPVVGPWRRKLATAFAADLAVYSAHLPLDLHPAVGNNALLCKALALRGARPFLEIKGAPAGLRAAADLPLTTLLRRLEAAVGGPVQFCAGGPARCRQIGVITGGAGTEVARAAAEGIDTFITGEGPHWTFPLAEELGVNLLYAGHYATETFGVKALASRAARRFRLPWAFLDSPTGL
jgi:dinuclear metal center YbgI/SA1388 family protein